MSQWSNRSKGVNWPGAVIESNKAWPETKDEKENWKNLVLPNRPGMTGSSWAQFPKSSKTKGIEFTTKRYLDFLRWRSKEWSQKINEMLESIEKNGF